MKERYFPHNKKLYHKIIEKEYQKGRINHLIEFASEKMKERLLKNLDKPGWWNESFDYLFSRLNEEVEELLSAVMLKKEKEEIIKECADIANFAFMIASNYRQSN